MLRMQEALARAIEEDDKWIAQREEAGDFQEWSRPAAVSGQRRPKRADAAAAAAASY